MTDFSVSEEISKLNICFFHKELPEPLIAHVPWDFPGKGGAGCGGILGEVER